MAGLWHKLARRSPACVPKLMRRYEFMNPFEKPTQPEQNYEQLTPLTVEQVKQRLLAGENLEKTNLKKLNLTGIDMPGASLRFSDVRNISFDDGQETITNLNDTDWTDCIIGTVEAPTELVFVDAQNAKFGYSETLDEKRLRLIEQKAQGKIPTSFETGAFYNFNGSCSDFTGSVWTNIDFGGATGWEAIFFSTKFNDATFDNCDLMEIDLSKTFLANAKFIDPVSLAGMIITEKQIPDLIKGIVITNDLKRATWQEKIASKGETKALEDHFKIIIIEQVPD